MKSNLLITILVLTSINLAAQKKEMVMTADSNWTAPAFSIDSMAWLSGYWKGEAMGTDCEEIWSAPSHGSMVCAFKMSKGNEVIVYEIVILRELNESVILQLKHFSNDLIAWEEKDESLDFKFIKRDNNIYYFDGFTFELVDKNHLNIYVLIGKEGEKEEAFFSYSRAN